MGIGHRIKSINNPDIRVKIIKEFVIENFPAHPLLDYALEVEKITTSKKPNLILNVDGIIATSFVDMLRNCGSFTRWVGFSLKHFIKFHHEPFIFPARKLRNTSISVRLTRCSSLAGASASSVTTWTRSVSNKAYIVTHGTTFHTFCLKDITKRIPLNTRRHKNTQRDTKKKYLTKAFMEKWRKSIKEIFLLEIK